MPSWYVALLCGHMHLFFPGVILIIFPNRAIAQRIALPGNSRDLESARCSSCSLNEVEWSARLVISVTIPSPHIPSSRVRIPERPPPAALACRGPFDSRAAEPAAGRHGNNPSNNRTYTLHVPTYGPREAAAQGPGWNNYVPRPDEVSALGYASHGRITRYNHATTEPPINKSPISLSPTVKTFCHLIIFKMVTQVAVLDDYHDLAVKHFSKLDSSKFDIKYFPTTLRPYNHEDTPQAEKDELVARLEPFEVIGKLSSIISLLRAYIFTDASSLATMRERTPFPSALIERLPRLKLLLSCGRHNKAIDMEACRARLIPVTGSGDGIAVHSTLEHIVTLILASCHDIAQNDAAVKAGNWQTSLVTAVTGKTLGLIGLGRLGSSVARIMSSAFGMRIIAWSANLTQDVADAQARSQGLAVEGPDSQKTFKSVGRDELFSSSDVVSVHLLLSDRTQGLITSGDLSKMKPSSFFVNTSRGPLVVENDLLDVLRAGKIRGAALDVFNLEPLPADSEWRNSDWGTNCKSRVLVTPHIAYVEESVMNGFYKEQVEELERWSKGETLKKTMY
jgi:phosphoglycerate dehydrogenase-like enzyme